MDHGSALDGLRVHLTAHRRSREIDEALARQGASILHAPTLIPVPGPEDVDLPGRTDAVIAFRPEILVVTTGIGLRSWAASADAHGQGVRLRDVLGSTRIIARGAKALGAVRALGLDAEWVAPGETAQEIIDHLLQEDLQGRRIVIQFHGMGTDTLDTTLRDAGAQVCGVVVYRYTTPSDPEPVRRALEETAKGRVDAVLFTAAGGAEHWLRAATAEQLHAIRERNRAGDLGLFAVGSVTATPLEDQGLSVHRPERQRLGALLREVRSWAEQRAAVGGERP